MISKTNLEKIAKSRLGEAKILKTAKKFDGAIYLCGYAVEIALKAAICTIIARMKGFPEEKNEFEFTNKLKTHDLDNLAALAGLKDKIAKPRLKSRWSIVNKWNSEFRYKPIGTATEKESEEMINATAYILAKMGL